MSSNVTRLLKKKKKYTFTKRNNKPVNSNIDKLNINSDKVINAVSYLKKVKDLWVNDTLSGVNLNLFVTIKFSLQCN